jgi:hypothetical protein
MSSDGRAWTTDPWRNVSGLPEVVMATVRGVENVVASRVTGDISSFPWMSEHGLMCDDADVTDRRPLLLIDPKGRRVVQVRPLAFFFGVIALLAFVATFALGYVAIFTHSPDLGWATALSFILSLLSGLAATAAPEDRP